MEEHGPRASTSIDEETLWQLSLRENECVENGSYPKRPGEPDCSHYSRTGLCRFGMTCRFNHPPNRNLVAAAAMMQGGYPERVGLLECQYYLKTGTCQFGATCKFHHPKDRAGIIGSVQLNSLGCPLHPDEKECAYYMRTGQCKFGTTCKFLHPRPSDVIVSLGGSSVYTSVHSPTSVRQSYSGGLANWSVSRASYIPSPHWQGLSSYAQLILPQGLVQVPSWNTFSGQLGSESSPENQQATKSETTKKTRGTFSSYLPGSVPLDQHAAQKNNIFPERPDQPECQFDMKTGDCKFGAICRFHHPKERFLPAPGCALTPLGLPLCPGEHCASFTLIMVFANLGQIANLIIQWKLQWGA